MSRALCEMSVCVLVLSRFGRSGWRLERMRWQTPHTRRDIPTGPAPLLAVCNLDLGTELREHEDEILTRATQEGLNSQHHAKPGDVSSCMPPVASANSLPVHNQSILSAALMHPPNLGIRDRNLHCPKFSVSSKPLAEPESPKYHA